MDQCEGEVLEEEETQKLAHSDVRPTSVHQQEALQITELSKSVVTGHDGLHSLLTTDSHTDVCSWRGQTGGDELEPRHKNEYHMLTSLSISRRLLLIMLTSLAPSPIDSVTAFLYFFTKLTTFAFCLGVTRQQMTASHSQAMFTKSICGYFSFC